MKKAIAILAMCGALALGGCQTTKQAPPASRPTAAAPSETSPTASAGSGIDWI
jgi:hypothetical protein